MGTCEAYLNKGHFRPTQIRAYRQESELPVAKLSLIQTVAEVPLSQFLARRATRLALSQKDETNNCPFINADRGRSLRCGAALCHVLHYRRLLRRKLDPPLLPLRAGLILLDCRG